LLHLLPHLLLLLLLLLLLQACMAANAIGCSDHAESFCTLVVAKPAVLEDASSAER
jgi:phosphate/sulfate permease